jgi:hypothetical protein
MVMAIDYSIFAIPKSRVKALDKADKAKAIDAKDKKESAKAKKRAKGRCEMRLRVGVLNAASERCKRKDAHTHHLISGIGRRNKGDSILASSAIRTSTQRCCGQ